MCFVYEKLNVINVYVQVQESRDLKSEVKEVWRFGGSIGDGTIRCDHSFITSGGICFGIPLRTPVQPTAGAFLPDVHAVELFQKGSDGGSLLLIVHKDPHELLYDWRYWVNVLLEAVHFHLHAQCQEPQRFLRKVKSGPLP